MDAHRNRALLESVRQHLMEDQRLAGQSLTVTSSAGHIQIIGSVDTEEQKRLAIDLARGVVGVRDVIDRIDVREPYIGQVAEW
ncbi:MAG: BON domain-containing protein [Armatimonadota bacterium]|nr:BON domain-containing protein [Armatimonadota bacterium]